MGGTLSQADTNTYVANATGVPIRVFYSAEDGAMELDEMVLRTGDGRTSGSGTFKKNSRISYIHVPVGSVGQIKGEGDIHVSIFAESCLSGETCEKVIALNFRVNWDRSIIVTKEHQINFQKYGGNVWKDDSGKMHN